MAQYTWQFTLDNRPHTVSAEVVPFGGIRSLQVDGADARAANEGRFDTASLRSFNIDGLAAQVVKFAGGAGLLLDGKAIPAAPGQPLPARLQKYEAQRTFWGKLAELTGLHEAPRADGLLEFRNRLIGTADNRLVVLDYSVSYQFIRPRITLYVRFAEEKDLNELRGRIERDPAVLQMLKHLKRASLEMTVQSTGAVILLPYDVRKTSPELAAEDVRVLLNVIKKYTKPIPLSYCDWGACKSANHPRELVFYNHSPLIVCSTCMPLLEKAGEVNQQRYNKRAPGMLKAVSAGLAVAAIVGVFFGIWKVSLVLAIGAFALFFATVGAMNRLTVKRTPALLWIASGLTLLGVAVASLMEATLKLMRSLTDAGQIEYGMVFTRPETLRLMATNLAIALAVTGIALWFALHQQQQAVHELTHPTIEHSGVQS